MSAQDLREMDDRGLVLRQQDLSGELAALRFRHASNRLAQNSELKRVRRELARLNTLIREREISREMSAGALAASVGKIEAEYSPFAIFRQRVQAPEENG
jgi:large subunit ribosomal protein L29